MKRPRKLYRFSISSKSWDVVREIKPEDHLEVVEHYPWGTLWRGRWLASGDHYGYATKGEAKVEALLNLQEELMEIQALINKFSRKKGA